MTPKAPRQGFLTFTDGELRLWVEQGRYNVVATLADYIAICGGHGAKWSDAADSAGPVWGGAYKAMSQGQKDVIAHTSSWNA